MAQYGPLTLEEERVASRQRLCKVKSKHNEAKAKLDKIIAERARLEAQLKELWKHQDDAKEALDSADKLLEDAAVSCSKAESPTLAHAINEKLPREIRDLIYELCWNDELQKYGPNYDPWNSYANSWPHFVLPEFVGQEAAEEAGAVFYRIVPAVVDAGRASRGRRLTSDFFDLGLAPTDYLSTIIFPIYPHHVSGTKIPQPYANWVSRFLLDAPFPQTKNFPKVTFDLREIRPAYLFSFLEIIRPACRKLKSRGSIIACNWEWTFSSQASPLQARLEVLLDLPRAQWTECLLAACKDPKSPHYDSVKTRIACDLRKGKSPEEYSDRSESEEEEDEDFFI
ncbi:hypothetical protein BU26DRAFT_551710 [Trematosphaeria pertusa]|uniref:Uncharacterized protein n=1 Tax=Trematosphaeria pertusa TaxID=390896 RepID=A0A6A6IFV1_9PLEO|nr:uncharacterized protein BU26DRAFT_551710 [Trematosphaeria pertusa]KAF2248403.1 hypothetical protein BU26DRAFT_551710 [Trematosphaeria pertusa]